MFNQTAHIKTDLSAVNQSLFTAGSTFTGRQLQAPQKSINTPAPQMRAYNVSMSAVNPNSGVSRIEASVPHPSSTAAYLQSLNTATPVNAAVPKNTSSYMDATDRSITTTMQSKQSFDTQKIANNTYQTAPVMSQTIEHAKIAPQNDAIQKNEVAKTEEVTFKIEHLQEGKEAAVVNSNHFSTGTLQTRAPVKRAVDNTFGQVMLNMYKSMQGIKKEHLAIPAFASIFATLMLGVPTPAFAATAAAIAPAAPSAMTKLLKNVFCAGAAAVFTVTFIHPIDVVKTRLQVASANGEKVGIGGIIGGAMKNEGPGAFYKGIGPAWLREASYTSLRLGLYEPVKMLVGASAPGAGFLRKFLAGALAGAIGSCAGNPFDVLKTKMMADKDAKGAGLGKYASEIMKAEGIAGFYKGFNTNVVRAMVLNATKMACYDQCKMFLITSFALEGLLLQFCAAFTAGFFLTCTVSPFDKCRTLLMNQKSGEKAYNGLGDAFMSILKKEGPLGFYKGFIPIWSRFAPTTCLQLITFEQLKRLPFIALA